MTIFCYTVSDHICQLAEIFITLTDDGVKWKLKNKSSLNVKMSNSVIQLNSYSWRLTEPTWYHFATPISVGKIQLRSFL